MKDLVNYVINNFDQKNQDLILIEEMSELTKELLKKRREKDNWDELIEEMSHVYISLEVVKTLYGISDKDIQKQVDLKKEKYDIYK